MKFEEILLIKDDSDRLNEMNNYNDSKNLKLLQKIRFVNRFYDQNILIEFFRNEYTFSKDILLYTIENVFNDSTKSKIANDNSYSWLRDKIKSLDLEESDISDLINSYSGSKDVINLFDKSKEYYNKNESLIIRKTTFNYDEQSINRIFNLEKVNKQIQNDAKPILKQLLDVNDEVLETVNFDILSKKYQSLGEKLTVVTLYPDIQSKILSLSNKEYDFFVKSLDYLEYQNLDWIPLADDLLENIKEYSNIINRDLSFSRYINNVPTNGESMEDFEKILTIMTSKNKYKLNSFSELINFDRKKMCNEYWLETINDDEFNKLSDIDKMRSLIFEKVFGQDFETAKRFFAYYGQDYDEVIKEAGKPESEIEKYVSNIKKIPIGTEEYIIECDKIKQSNRMISQYLQLSKKIFYTNNIEDLKKIYIAADSIQEINIPNAILDSSFRQFFGRLKNEKIYTPNVHDKIKVGDRDVYVMSGDYCYQLTSLEAYTKANGELKTQDWNSKKIRGHLISTIYGGSKNLSLPPIHGVCYGFSGYDERALQKSAPYDLGAWAYGNKFDVYKRQAEFTPRFCTPKTQLREEIRRHGEDALERKNYNYGKDSIFKLQPSYTVSFVEPPLSSYLTRPIKPSEILTAERLASLVDYGKLNDITYRQSIIGNELQNDIKWEKSKKDADSKGIDMTVVDRTHTLIQQRLEMDRKEAEFLAFSNSSLNDPNNMNKFLTLMEDIIYDFDSSRSGNIQKEILGWANEGGSVYSVYGDLLHKEMYETLFSYKVMDDKLGKMEAKFNSLDPDKYKQCMKKMQEISKKQVESMETQYWWYEYDTSHDWYDYYIYAGRCLSGIKYENQDAKIKSMLDAKMYNSKETGGQAVKRIIKEIDGIKEYDIPKEEPDWHGRRHINDVVLFSYLIAKNEGGFDKSMDLLLQAAKYHDVGRDGNWNGMGDGRRHDKDLVPHAYPSALAAEFYLKKELNPDGSRKYTDNQIAMIKVAIEYHEVNEKNKNQFDEEEFKKLCKSERVDPASLEETKKMCVYLKDADALDRTRFLYENPGSRNFRAFKDNLDVRYLRTNSAIALRDFSRAINDKHYENHIRKVDKLYIPDVLNSYTVNMPTNIPIWNQTKNEIEQFMRTQQEVQPKDKLSKDDIRELIGSPQKQNMFCKIRKSFKGIIDRIRSKNKNDNEKRKNVDHKKGINYEFYDID